MREAELMTIHTTTGSAQGGKGRLESPVSRARRTYASDPGALVHAAVLCQPHMSLLWFDSKLAAMASPAGWEPDLSLVVLPFIHAIVVSE